MLKKNVKGEKVYITFVFSYNFYVKILRYFVVINCCVFVFVFCIILLKKNEKNFKWKKKKKVYLHDQENKTVQKCNQHNLYTTRLKSLE